MAKLFPLKRKTKKKWIQGMNLKEGAFTAKAKAAGMSVQAFAAHVTANEGKYDTKTIRQAVLAQRFNKMANA